MPRTRVHNSDDSVPHISLHTPPRRPKKQPLQDITSHFVPPEYSDDLDDASSTGDNPRSPTPTPAAPRSALRRESVIAAALPSIRRNPVMKDSAALLGSAKGKSRLVPPTPTPAGHVSSPQSILRKRAHNEAFGHWPGHRAAGGAAVVTTRGSPLPPSSPPEFSTYPDSSHPKRSQLSQVYVEPQEPEMEGTQPLPFASSQLPFETAVERDDDGIPNEEGPDEEYADENVHPNLQMHSTSYNRALSTSSNTTFSDPFGFLALERRLKEQRAKNPNLLPLKRDYAFPPHARPVQPRTPHKPKYRRMIEESDGLASSEDVRKKYTNSKYHESSEDPVDASSAPSTPSPMKRPNPRPSLAASILPLTYEEPVKRRIEDSSDLDARAYDLPLVGDEVDDIDVPPMPEEDREFMSSPIPERLRLLTPPDEEDPVILKPVSNRANAAATPAKRATRSSAAPAKKATAATPAAKKVAAPPPSTRGRKRKAGEEAEEKRLEVDDSEEDAMEVEEVVGVRTRSRTARSTTRAKTVEKSPTKKARTAVKQTPANKATRAGLPRSATTTSKKYAGAGKRAAASKSENQNVGKGRAREANGKEKAKGKLSEPTDGMDSEQREKWERERQERIDYFKKLEGYAVAKENVYVI